MFYDKIAILLLLSSNTFAKINTTLLGILPPLFVLENYNNCILRGRNSKYCLLLGEIEPNPQSELWLNVENYSRDPQRRFRHDILFFGVCVDKCKDKLGTLENNNSPNNANIWTNEIVEYYELIHADEINNRLLYHNYLGNCVNYEFHQKYNLTVRTFIEYCDNSEDQHTKNDGSKTIFYAVLFTLFGFNIFSTAFDYFLKQKQMQSVQHINHYMKELNSTGQTILVSFSICRNYKRLTRPCVNQSENDLQFTYGFRVFTMFIVILGHVLMIITSIPVKNTEFIENHFDEPVSMIFQNGSALIQIFFVLSGFLLKCNFEKKPLIASDSAGTTAILVYSLYFIDRYLRLIPSLMFLVFFNITYLHHLESGPVWRHISEGERVLCSKFWWKNMLMINNFMMKDSCAHHTWYLAADMQLYELFLIVLIATAKWPRVKKSIYAFLGVLAFIVPGMITYLYNLDAFPYLKPESYRYFYFKDVMTFYTTYPQFYCNLGGYLVGFLCAELYITFIREGKSSSFAKYRKNLKVQIPLLLIMLTIGFGLLFSGLLVYDRQSNVNEIWIALYAACYRNIWAILGGFALVCMLLKYGWIAYEISCLPFIRVLGRVTFEMYMWHTTILRILFGFYHEPIYLNNFYMLCQIVLACIFTILLALFITIFVDFPISSILNCLLKQTKKRMQQNVDVSRVPSSNY